LQALHILKANYSQHVWHFKPNKTSSYLKLSVFKYFKYLINISSIR